MAAHVEYQFISRVLDYQDFHTVQKARITEDFFFEALCKQVFSFVRDHYISRYTYGSVPSWDIVLQRFPAFQRAYTNDTVATLCEQLHQARLSIQLRSLADQLYEISERGDPRDGLDVVREHAALLSSQHERSDDLLMSDAYEPLRREYDLVASGHGLLGIPWPWEIVNQETQGLQGGQFIVLYGRPGQMKTWVGLAIASHAYIRAKQRVLVVSMEMPGIDIQRRAASVCAAVDYQKLRKATLQPYDVEKFFQWLHFLKDSEKQAGDGYHHPAFLATSGIGNGVGMVRAKITEFQPDLVIVDGLYRMKDDRTRTRSIDWKNVTNVVQDLNETAKSLSIPIIGITQANRAAAKSSPKDADVAEMAFADALGQECDLAIRVKKDRDPQTHENEIILSFPKSREYEVENVVIHGLPGVNFGFKRVWVPQATDSNAQQSKNGNNGAKNHGGQANGFPGGGYVVPKPNFARY